MADNRGTGSHPPPARDQKQAELARLRREAESGDPQALFLLGCALGRGLGGRSDLPGAVACFKQAAAQGHRKARVSLGYCLATGRGVPKDVGRGYMLLYDAALDGDRDAAVLAEKVAQRIHGEELRRLEDKVRRQRVLRRLQKDSAQLQPTRSSSPPERQDGDGEAVIEVEIPRGASAGGS